MTAIDDLDQRLTLESPSRAPDGGGGAIVTWQTVGDVWASVHPISGDERLRADQVAGRITHTVVIRRRTDVTPAMRFRSRQPRARDRRRSRRSCAQPPALPVRGTLPVKITAHLIGAAALARLDLSRLRDRLAAAIERQAPSSLPVDRARDTDARQRFSSPLRGEVGTPRT